MVNGIHPTRSNIHSRRPRFDFNDTMHHRMLRTIYCKLARCKVCPRTGSHWEAGPKDRKHEKTRMNKDLSESHI